MDNDISEQKEEFFRGELERLGNYFSDFTNRIGVLMTIGGLLSFLPSLLGEIKEGYLEYFLIWTFPFLLIVLTCYYPASIRVQSVVKRIPFAPKGTNIATEILKNRTKHLELVWRKTIYYYDNTLFWYKIANAFMYAYFVSFSLNFYMFTFSGKPSICISLAIEFLSLAAIGTILFFSKMKSGRGLDTDSLEFDIATGGPLD